MPQISVIICCANAGDTLEQACQSVAWADELLIVDSGSTDDTAAIARRYATRYVEEPWRGHTGQKQFAADLAAHDWIFVVDSDEECSRQLASEIQSLSDDVFEGNDILLTPRRNYVMGRLVRSWWPDHLTRVFHRKRVTWPGHVLHDTRAPSSPDRVHRLNGWLVHKRHSQAAFEDYFSGKRMDDRLLPVARQMYDRGKRCRWWDLLLRPTFAFWKFYLIKRSFLDGVFGLMIAQKAASSTQLKYAALWAVQHQLAGDDDQKPAG